MYDKDILVEMQSLIEKYKNTTLFFNQENKKTTEHFIRYYVQESEPMQKAGEVIIDRLLGEYGIEFCNLEDSPRYKDFRYNLMQECANYYHSLLYYIFDFDLESATTPLKTTILEHYFQDLDMAAIADYYLRRYPG